jgi:hypothetical protein
MAFQQWEENYLRAIMNSFTAAGYESVEEITAMLTRNKLEQELRTLQSQATIMAATEDVQNQVYVQSWAAKQAEIQAKQQEIDALAAG